MEWLSPLLGEGVFTLVATFIGGIVTFFKSFRFVQEGERGLKVRFGKVVRNRDRTPKIIEPGFVLMIPWIETLKRRHVRQQTLQFEKQRILLPSGLIFEVSATVIFRVKDIYKALFDIDELDASLQDYCMAVLRDEFSQHERHEDLARTEEVSERLIERVRIRADEWGVEFISFSLTNSAPTPESAQLVGAKIGALLRMEALAAAAGGHGFTVHSLPPGLASVLVGIPVVASIGGANDSVIRVETSNNGLSVSSDEDDDR